MLNRTNMSIEQEFPSIVNGTNQVLISEIQMHRRCTILFPWAFRCMKDAPPTYPLGIQLTRNLFILILHILKLYSLRPKVVEAFLLGT